MVLVPLIYPSALPSFGMRFLMVAPAIRPEEPKPMTRVAPVSTAPRQIDLSGHITAPRLIPPVPFIPDRPEVSRPMNVATTDFGESTNPGNIFTSQEPRANVRSVTTGTVRVSGSVVEGLLVHRTIPVYPPVARAAGVEGTVVLQATITRAGIIENLRVVSGPMLLQNAAMSAVREWRYRPYLLSGEPVEVETTVNVIFKLN
jgi:protein TonB